MPLTHHLLVVGRNLENRQKLVEQLALSEEFAILASDNASEAIQKAQEQRVDLVVLDAGDPDPEGCAPVRLLRRRGFRSPIIMVSGKGSEADMILGLDAGANDYVMRPFSLMVLMARIRAQLRQYASSEDAIFQIGPYSFRPSAKLLIKDNGSRLKLTEKETAIIRLLFKAGQKLVSREKLLSEVWGYNAAVATHTLETHVYRLRRKLDAIPSAAQMIVTERGGYRLVP